MATEITPRAQVLTRPQVLGESWTMREFVAATNTPWDTITFLARRRLLTNTSLCLNCRVNRHLHAVRRHRAGTAR